MHKDLGTAQPRQLRIRLEQAVRAVTGSRAGLGSRAGPGIPPRTLPADIY